MLCKRSKLRTEIKKNHKKLRDEDFALKSRTRDLETVDLPPTWSWKDFSTVHHDFKPS